MFKTSLIGLVAFGILTSSTALYAVGSLAPYDKNRYAFGEKKNDGKTFPKIDCNGWYTWYQGFKYGCIVSNTGRVWLDRNIGASSVSKNGEDPASYGGWFQWGRPFTGHALRVTRYHQDLGGDRYALQNPFLDDNDFYCINPNSDYLITSQVRDADGVSRSAYWSRADGYGSYDANRSSTPPDSSAPPAVCPQGFRVPTLREMEAEVASWNSLDARGAFESLKLPLGGMRWSHNGNYITRSDYLSNSDYNPYWGDDTGRAAIGGYWTATPQDNDHGAHALTISRDRGIWWAAKYGASSRGMGYMVRCIQDADVAPLMPE
ncbi:MAG: hypothetical protein LGB66_03855 [Sulfurovum sp.]|nr:hypothetical protein [Sulfurovum sp.]